MDSVGKVIELVLLGVVVVVVAIEAALALGRAFGAVAAALLFVGLFASLALVGYGAVRLRRFLQDRERRPAAPAPTAADLALENDDGDASDDDELDADDEDEPETPQDDASDEVLDHGPPSPVTATVVDELERLDGPQGTLRQGVAIFAISLLLFVGAERSMSEGFTFVVHLVIVMAFHEAGHWVAMKAFGYRDLRVFFIPFLGAAVSGKNHAASGAQRAVVSLAGPVPGIAASFVLAIGNGMGVWEIPEDLLNIMLVLNLYNLLPFEPLDGGRLMNVLVYHRFPMVESAMRAIGVVLMIGAAIAWEDWFLGLFGLTFAIGVGRAARLAVAARALRRTLTTEDLGSHTIPRARREQVGRLAAAQVLAGVDVYSQPKVLAAAMNDLWAKALVSPTSLVATILFLAFYIGLGGFFTLLAIIA